MEEAGLSPFARRDDDEEEPAPGPRPPSPHTIDHAGLLDLVSRAEFSHQTTLRVLRLHPEWLSTRPPADAAAARAGETPLHAVVRTGNLRLLEMLLAEHHLELDLAALDAQGQTVLAAARAVAGTHPRMARRVEDLRAFEEEAHALAADEGRLRDRAAQDALVAALTRRLDWISAPHHKAWAVLHHLVHHGDVALLERVVGIPGAFAAVKLRARTKDCKRTVVELALGGNNNGGNGNGNDESPMAVYLRETLGPMFGLHLLRGEEGGEGGMGGGGGGGYDPRAAAFPRVRSVAAASVKVRGGNGEVDGEWVD